ncbi:hypothetical protein MTO96_009724 [Rhipicephalus appendiculatus]
MLSRAASSGGLPLIVQAVCAACVYVMLQLKLTAPSRRYGASEVMRTTPRAPLAADAQCRPHEQHQLQDPHGRPDMAFANVLLPSSDGAYPL